MSEQNKDGGRAFPSTTHTDDGHLVNGPEFGMSLRDYFAAAASTGLLAGFQGPSVPWAADPEQSPVACKSYEIADAMLKARLS